VIWGGGGTNNNEVFVYIAKLILCKIYDEKEADPGEQYAFQRLGDVVSPERSSSLVERMNKLYKQAEESYLALPEPSKGVAFDATRISVDKIAYVVGRLESISMTQNRHQGDLLGEFFEQIVGQDFTQSKGQFFTPYKLVQFMLHISGATEFAKDTMLNQKDHLGRHRLPYVIDPSCGVGTFLTEYMKRVRDKLGDPNIAAGLSMNLREEHNRWFSGFSGNAWAREYLFGIENNYDLGLAAKVNMVLHGDGSTNTWINSALLPFEDYWIDTRHNVLGTSQVPNEHPYRADRNEQFDLLFSNPPFAIDLSPDEKKKVKQSFDVLADKQSEETFIERWYQLLREGGRFCCVLPEAVLDTSSNADVRIFLLQHFKIEAVVALPYDAFRPFTSTKTCIVLASKRSAEDVQKWKAAWDEISSNSGKIPQSETFRRVIVNLGWEEQEVFMAEPTSVGYKRRKNLPDLATPNDLYSEGTDDGLAPQEGVHTTSTVLDTWLRGPQHEPSDRFGFWTNLQNVASRDGFRLDPKYRWLWDFEEGVAHGTIDNAEELRSVLEIVKLQKVKKGKLENSTQLIDLEHVESRQALQVSNVPNVEIVGSEKVRFENSELVFSKLEPYLAKIIVEPPSAALGSTEWVGMKRIEGVEIPLYVLAYLLMTPGLCDAYQRLQGGKRHARLDPEEILDLRVQLPDSASMDDLATEIVKLRDRILHLRKEEKSTRKGIDELF
jgi:type I restriction enzyme M protein